MSMRTHSAQGNCRLHRTFRCLQATHEYGTAVGVPAADVATIVVVVGCDDGAGVSAGSDDCNDFRAARDILRSIE